MMLSTHKWSGQGPDDAVTLRPSITFMEPDWYPTPTTANIGGLRGGFMKNTSTLAEHAPCAPREAKEVVETA